MNDFWDRMKRELRDAIRESGRPELMLAIVSGVTAWALTSVLRLGVTVLQSQYSLALVLQRRVARFPTSPG